MEFSNFEGCDFTGADFQDVELFGSKLFGSTLDNIDVGWSSHQLIAEILRQAAGDDVGKLGLAGIVYQHHHKCWDSFISMKHPDTVWALRLLAKRIKDDSTPPNLLLEYASKEKE